MEQQLLIYFQAEKRAGALALALGLIAVLAAILLWRRAEWRGMAYPLGILGVIEVAVGVVLIARTDAQVARLTAQLRDTPVAYQQAETARMEKVQRSFTVIEIIEVAVFAAGVALSLAFRNRPSHTLWTIGLGLILQSSALLVFDLIAERRGANYLKSVREMPPPLIRSTAEDHHDHS